jgi:hypothetical protein
VIARWRWLGSLKLTLVILVLLAASVLAAYFSQLRTSLWVVAALALLALNLLVALVTQRFDRHKLPLQLFHWALLASLLLLAVGRVTYLRGQLELVQGEEFSGTLTQTDAGPWHYSRLDQLRFVNEGFTIGYSVGLQRDQTRNLISFLDADGHAQQIEIGDQIPLVLRGYRFYTTPNKGFAPTFSWQPAAGGRAVLGSVHLPPYPAHEYKQAKTWTLPGTSISVWAMLQFDEIILSPDRPSEFKLPSEHQLIIRIDEQRYQLKPGEAIELKQGRLVYVGLRSWMGYTVFYDWTIHWLLATSALAVAAMGWHFWRKFTARPWDA